MVALIVCEAFHLQSSTVETKQKSQSKHYHQQQKVQGRQRSVRFADYIRVREIPHYSTLSDKERQACYWSKQDRERIQQDIILILRTNIQQHGGIFCYLDEDSLRGLEVFASMLSSSSSPPPSSSSLPSISPVLRRRASKMILKRQRIAKQIDEDWLRKEYRPFSQAAEEIARARGLRDEEVAPFFAPRLNLMVR